jgi:TRAP-type C4-dicarboxylate transport system permease small subunit
VTQVVIICIVVFGRLVLNKTPGWGEPGALMFMVWFSLMSASLGVLEDEHLRITFTELFLPPALIRFFDIFSLFIILIFSLFMIVYGSKMTELSTLNVMAGLGIKSSWLFASIPAAGVALFLAVVEKVIKELWKKK